MTESLPGYDNWLSAPYDNQESIEVDTDDAEWWYDNVSDQRKDELLEEFEEIQELFTEEEYENNEITPDNIRKRMDDNDKLWKEFYGWLEDRYAENIYEDKRENDAGARADYAYDCWKDSQLDKE